MGKFFYELFVRLGILANEKQSAMYSRIDEEWDRNGTPRPLKK